MIRISLTTNNGSRSQCAARPGDEEDADGLYRPHLKGPVFLAAALLLLIAGGSHIVLPAIATKRVAIAGSTSYVYVKVGLGMFARCITKVVTERCINHPSGTSLPDYNTAGLTRRALSAVLFTPFAIYFNVLIGLSGDIQFVCAAVAMFCFEQKSWENHACLPPEFGGASRLVIQPSSPPFRATSKATLASNLMKIRPAPSVS